MREQCQRVKKYLLPWMPKNARIGKKETTVIDIFCMVLLKVVNFAMYCIITEILGFIFREKIANQLPMV